MLYAVTTIGRIRRHIAQKQPGRPFSIREFLSYGSRAAVDQAVGRLVAYGRIQRVARGIYCRPGPPGMPPPHTSEIATVKAEAFGKQITAYWTNLAAQFGLSGIEATPSNFGVSGSSSSFMFGSQRIHLVKTGARKLALLKCELGKVLRILWHMRERTIELHMPQLLSARKRFSTEEVFECAKLAPAWLTDALEFRPRIGAIWAALRE